MWGGQPYGVLSAALKIRNVAEDGILLLKHNVAAPSILSDVKVSLWSHSAHN
jgi:hypothetical protein